MLKFYILPAALIIALAACGEPKPPLPVKVSRSGLAIAVRNDSAWNFGDCKITINGSFTARLLLLPALKTRSIPIRNFADDDGLRFNLLSHRLKTVDVACFDHPEQTSAFANFEWR